jgi:glycosyltransferase involved in cell wall biosynthesis
LNGGPLRVAVVTSRLDVGGTERHIARILPALQRRGLDVVLYLMERGGLLEAEISARGVRIEGPLQSRRLLHWPILRWSMATLDLARWLRRERPTVVHFFLPRPYLFGSLAAALAGQRRRLMSRRSLTDYRAKYPLLGTVERYLHRRTFGILGNSQAVIDQLATEVDDRRKLGLIYNGIEMPSSVFTNRRQQTRALLQVPSDALVVSVIANLIAYKGHRDLIEALALIADRLPRPWRLLAIGRDDGIGGELADLAQSRGIAGNIMWLGERSDVEELLSASDIFVLPSHQEGFSNALLEAMAARLPAVATAVGGNIDAVAADETGVLVPVRDPRALAAAILRLAQDPETRRSFGEAARRRVEQRFSLPACVDRYEKLYRALGVADPPPVSEILSDAGHA